MNRRRYAIALASLLLLATGAGCSDDDPTPAATEPSGGSPSTVATSSEPATSPLEGKWSASIPKKAALANLRRAGFGDVAEKVVAENADWDLELRIAGDQLVLFTDAGEIVDGDETITIKGDQMVVESAEVPGEAVLRFKVDETKLKLWFVSQNRPELAPGLNEEPIIRLLYTIVPWTRVS
jgi:hypothetical protein